MERPTERTHNNRLREEVSGWPTLTFHYGLSFDDLRRMPRNIRGIYIRKLPELLAAQQHRAIQAASFAHMEGKDQKDAIERLNSSLPDTTDEDARAQTEAMAKLTGGDPYAGAKLAGIQVIGPDDSA